MSESDDTSRERSGITPERRDGVSGGSHAVRECSDTTPERSDATSETSDTASQLSDE